MEQRDICMLVMFIIIIIMFFQIQKLSKNNNYENVTNTSQITDAQLTAINNQIGSIYNMDVEAIRNLGSISKSLLTGTNYHSTTVGTPGQLTIPADNTVLTGSLNVTSNLNVNGKQLIPPGIIMAWYQPTAPAGWGLCDGTKYGNIQSPDLRGRFIKMATIGMNAGDNYYDVTDTGNRDINTYYRGDNRGIIRFTAFGVNGGTDSKQLHDDEMPKHSHSYYHTPFVYANGLHHSQHVNESDWAAAHIDRNDGTGSAGNNVKHGVNSPYYTLVYIIYIG